MVLFGCLAACLLGVALLIIMSHLNIQRSLTKELANISIFLMFMSFILFLIGFIVWALVVKLVLEDCTIHNLPTDIAQSVCAKEGVTTAIITIVLLFATLAFNFLIAKKISKIESNSENREQRSNLTS